MPNDRSRIPSSLDLCLALVFASCLLLGSAAAVAAQGNRFQPLNFWGIVLVILAAACTVLLRREAPVWALSGTMLAVSTYMVAGYPYGPVQLCMVISMFEVARKRPLRVSLPVCGVAAIVASVIMLPRLFREDESPVFIAVAWTAWIVLPWSLGALVYLLAVVRVRWRRELVARGALEERMKIAGEVHDVAGHGFSVVAMQAGVALLVFDEQPEQARRSLESIQNTSTKSLTELRSMLDTFHLSNRDDPDPYAHPDREAVRSRKASGPWTSKAAMTLDVGMTRIEELLDQVRAGGLSVHLETENLDSPLPEELSAVAYRLIQESLTNVLRHAGPTRADVHIAKLDGELLMVEILDYGQGAQQEASCEGRGLTGMRRRVEEVGGRFEAGSREKGGFRTAAYLPWSAPTRRSSGGEQSDDTRGRSAWRARRMPAG